MQESLVNELLKDIKDYGYTNHIVGILLTIFFIYISKNLNLEFSVFTCIYWYVASLLMGHYAVHNVKPTKKFKYKKGKNDTFIALPFVGIVNMVTYGIPILIIDYFFKFL